MCRRPTRMRSHACSARRCRCGSSTNRRRASSPACSEVDHGVACTFSPHSPDCQLAKERLRIIVAQERSYAAVRTTCRCCAANLLEVIRKYVNVDPDAIQINFEKDGGNSVLELSVALPEKNAA